MGYYHLFEVIAFMRNEILKYQRIRDLREDRDITQKEIAEHLNIRQNSYSRYETNERDIPIEVLIKLAVYHNTSIDYLVGLTDEPKAYERKVRKM